MRTLLAFAMLTATAFAWEQPKMPILDWKPAPLPTLNEQMQQRALNIMVQRIQAQDRANIKAAEKADACNFRHRRFGN